MPSAAGRREHATQAFDEQTGAGMMVADVQRDETLQHPRCVFQILRRHFSRYTPEMVERIVRHHARARSGRSPTR